MTMRHKWCNESQPSKHCWIFILQCLCDAVSRVGCWKAEAIKQQKGLFLYLIAVCFHAMWFYLIIAELKHLFLVSLAQLCHFHINKCLFWCSLAVDNPTEQWNTAHKGIYICFFKHLLSLEIKRFVHRMLRWPWPLKDPNFIKRKETEL